MLSLVDKTVEQVESNFCKVASNFRFADRMFCLPYRLCMLRSGKLKNLVIDVDLKTAELLRHFNVSGEVQQQEEADAVATPTTPIVCVEELGHGSDAIVLSVENMPSICVKFTKEDVNYSSIAHLRQMNHANIEKTLCALWFRMKPNDKSQQSQQSQQSSNNNNNRIGIRPKKKTSKRSHSFIYGFFAERLCCSLEDISNRIPNAPPVSINKLATQMESALDYLHTVIKHVHGDIKPGNILVATLTTHEQLFKLGDTMSTTPMPTDQQQQQQQQQQQITLNCFTPGYLHPQTCVDLCDWGKQTDYWALGATLAEVDCSNGPLQIPFRNFSDIYGPLFQHVSSRSALATLNQTNNVGLLEHVYSSAVCKQQLSTLLSFLDYFCNKNTSSNPRAVSETSLQTNFQNQHPQIKANIHTLCKNLVDLFPNNKNGPIMRLFKKSVLFDMNDQ